jgi:hypothetical protein
MVGATLPTDKVSEVVWCKILFLFILNLDVVFRKYSIFFFQ